MAKNIHTYKAWLIGNIDIFIAIALSYLLGLILLKLPIPIFIAVLSVILCLIFFLKHPRSYIYAMVVIYPFTGLITKFTGETVLGGGYTGMNIGGLITIFGVLYGVLYLIIYRPKIFDYELTIPIILFMGIVLISVVHSPLFLFAFRKLSRYGSQAALYIIILSSFKGTKDAKRLLDIHLILFVVVSIYYLLAIYFPPLRGDIMRNINWSSDETELSADFSMYRLTGFHHSTAIGSYIVFYFALVIFYFYEAPVTKRLKYMMLFPMMLVLLYYTLARNSWIAFVFIMFVIGLFRFRIFIFSCLLLCLLTFAIFPGILDIIIMRMQIDDSAMGRITQLIEAWELFIQKPILGWGEGYYEYWHGVQSGMANKYGANIGGASHVAYFRILAEEGIVGLVINLFLFFSAWKLTYKLLISPFVTAKNYSIVAFATVTSIFIAGISAQGLEPLAYYFFVFLAMGELYLRSAREDIHDY